MLADSDFSPDTLDARREGLLEAAVSVFARFGYRKTSMDEVARAAGVSRQGLYLQFQDKEELFRKAVAFRLSRQLAAACAVLADEGESLETRLIAGCDEWAGRFVGMLGTDAADLMCASTSIAGATLIHYEARFEQALTRAIAASPLLAHCAALGLAPADLARTLHATTRGLKHSSKTRQDFLQGVAVAARMFCAPLRRPPPPEET